MRSTQVGRRFSDFYNNWVSQLEQFHYELLQASASCDINQQQQQLETLISKVTAHFKQYYTVKWAAAHEDVLLFMHRRRWLTPWEIAQFWFTGFKPTTAFKLTGMLKQKPEDSSALTELTEARMKAVGDIKMKVKIEEDKVESDMERVRVGVGNSKMVELARMTSQVMSDQGDLGRKVDGMSQAAVGSILAVVEQVMKAGDCMCLKAMKSVLDVLTPNQSVEFLAATAMVHVQLRKGLKLMSRNGPNSCN